jgi:hypothetical protein
LEAAARLGAVAGFVLAWGPDLGPAAFDALDACRGTASSAESVSRAGALDAATFGSAAVEGTGAGAGAAVVSGRTKALTNA